ncbi:SMP-30/gluconolactonase/LRE family protein [Terricaulis sp.]|uniref:SMP-30/gluconolactonase/LRE family protein n=1 Tax=Terricaulis sp. TaxID=2768686 RepID=UPI0037839A07
MSFEVIASGLQFPEGPIVMPDGSVIVVEIKRGTLTRCWKDKTEVIAKPGGGPNGAALGPDGAIYLCNNGGFAWHEINGLTIPGLAADDYETGRIERVDLNTGKVERVYEGVGGNKLRGPNDIVFEQGGAFWFTDLGKNWPRGKDRGGLYWAKTDGSEIKEASYGHVGLNGVGLSPDEKVVYAAETETGKLWAFDITAPGEVVRSPMGGPSGRCVAVQNYHCFFDSLAVQANGDVCVATILNGGITTITPAGVSTHTPFPDLITTNIAFGGADMGDAYITLSSTGQLVKARWPAPGKKLNFNPY